MDQREHLGLIKHLVLRSASKCTACGRAYTPESIGVLGREADLWFLSLTCQYCRNRVLVAALVKEQKATAVITDLTAEEQSKFQRAPKITTDDVLEMHEFLAEFDGDFARLFGNKN